MAFPLLAIPALMKAGLEIYQSVTGKEPPPEVRDDPVAFEAHIASLPPEQQSEIQTRLFAHIEALDDNSTERFQAMTAVETSGNVEAIRATARPEIAKRAMGVIETFSRVVFWLAIALFVEWGAHAVFFGVQDIRHGRRATGHGTAEVASC